MSNIVFIELNPFLSRLHVLSPLVQGASTRGGVHVILARRRYGGDLLEFLDSLPQAVQVHWLPQTTQPGRHIKLTEVWTAIRYVRALQLSGARLTKVVWTAIDDYMPSTPLIAASRAALGLRVGLVVIRYRVEDLLPDSLIRVRAKKMIGVLPLNVFKARTLIFDERVPQGTRRDVIVDPWDGPFRPLSDSVRSATPTVLMVGRQDSRKGFDIAARALILLHGTGRHFKVRVVGEVAPALKNELVLLEATFGPLFSQETRYMTDENLAEEFRQAKVVLMPYAPTFLGTSGVLARAAASGVPVVGPSTGLVGFRIRKHRLGGVANSSVPAEVSLVLAEWLNVAHDSAGAIAFARRTRASELSRWAAANL